MNRKSKELLRLLMILIGNILDAAGFVLFVSGSGLITGGTSGIGLFLSRQTDFRLCLYHQRCHAGCRAHFSGQTLCPLNDPQHPLLSAGNGNYGTGAARACSYQ